MTALHPAPSEIASLTIAMPLPRADAPVKFGVAGTAPIRQQV